MPGRVLATDYVLGADGVITRYQEVYDPADLPQVAVTIQTSVEHSPAALDMLAHLMTGMSMNDKTGANRPGAIEIKDVLAKVRNAYGVEG
jgi:hypothetical protein